MVLRAVRLYVAPEPVGNDEHDKGWPSVFLAGSIEQGQAEDWQREVIGYLQRYDDLVVLSPRREHWDPTWEQTLDNPQFVEQVEWELQGLDESQYVFMYLAPGTLSPVSLLEFGLLLTHMHDRLVVVCPDGFWRKGNIEVTARWWNDVPVYTSIEDGLGALDIILARDGVK